MNQKFFIVSKSNRDTAEMFVYGYIGPGEVVNSADFIRELRELEGSYANINVRINSGGGGVFEGITMYNAMKQSKANIETYNDGIAGSMGSILLCAGKKVHMSRSARVMTHKPSVGGYGNSDDLKNNALLLEGLEKTMSAIYSAKTGKTETECMSSFMNGKDTWFDADQALAAKLVDSIYDAPAVDIPKSGMDEKGVWDLYSQQEFAAVFKQNNDMKQNFLSVTALAALKLTDAADQSAIDTAINVLVAKANKADDLQTRLTTAEARIVTLEAAGTEKEVTDMLEAALNKDKKITVEMQKKLAADYKGRPTDLKALLDVMQPIPSISNEIKNNEKGASELVKLSWEELDQKGKLEELKAKDANAFYDKFKAKFNKKHKEDTREA